MGAIGSPSHSLWSLGPHLEPQTLAADEQVYSDGQADRCRGPVSGTQEKITDCAQQQAGLALSALPELIR